MISRILAYRAARETMNAEEDGEKGAARTLAGGFLHGIALVIAVCFIGWVLVTVVTGALQAVTS